MSYGVLGCAEGRLQIVVSGAHHQSEPWIPTHRDRQVGRVIARCQYPGTLAPVPTGVNGPKCDGLVGIIDRHAELVAYIKVVGRDESRNVLPHCRVFRDWVFPDAGAG